MGVVALPVNQPPQASVNNTLPENESDGVSRSEVLSGVDVFAALLAQQLGADAVPVSTGSEALPDPQVLDSAVLDPSLQLQQAALFMPAPVVNEIKAVPQQVMQGEQAVGATVGSSSTGPASVLKDASQRQPVAADAAAFAMPEDGFRLAAAKDFMPDIEQSTASQTLLQPQALPQNVAVTSQASASSSSNATQPSGSIPQPVGHSAWGEALGDRVVWMVGQQHQGVELHLNPPALGPLEVRLSMSDGQANLSFASHHASVRDAIELATPRLREMLGESGINLASVSVNVGSFTQQQQQPGNQAQSGSGPGQSWMKSMQAADLSSGAVTAVVSQLDRVGMVDIFA